MPSDVAGPFTPDPSRRRFLAAAGALAAGALLPARLRRAAAADAPGVRAFTLTAAPARVPLLAGELDKAMAVWAYDGRVPGPEIRVRQGERVRITVTNGLREETTVHWHGVRVPNAQDGVPHLTQEPIAPGARFVYEFVCPDAGTFWYHPHQRSFEQVGRGLYGPLIVEEREPPAVDRDLTWVLDDWRLTPEAEIRDDFGHPHDISHEGRIGNVVTVNGRTPAPLHMRTGERVRLRLINAANARIFALVFHGHRPRIVALDGQPCPPHEPPGGRVVLGPAMRADLILDGTGRPGERYTVRDVAYRRQAYELTDVVYGPTPLRNEPPPAPVELPANPLAEPDLARAERHEIRFQGGMMGGSLHGLRMNGRPVNPMQMMHAGKAWAINGVVATGHRLDPVLTLARGRSYRLLLANDTAWHHPMHLHGHSFRVLARDGVPAPRREWQDTVLVAPRERTEIALVADNPGDWMFHCHILEHQAGGMMAVVRVA